MIRQQTMEPPTIRVSAREGYGRWSRLYDSEANPMISLEQRFLGRLLRPVKGLDVVDLGCGTGRWLETLAALSPHSLIGIDSSEEMLARAEMKVVGGATLLEANCETPPLESASADLILCSFVLSYISNFESLAEQIRRIARCDADIFISDLHPETESRFRWRRGVRDGGEHVEVETHWRSLESVLAAFERQRMRPAAVLELPFGEPEFEILERAGRSALIGEVQTHPAIYILHLKPANAPAHPKIAARSEHSLGRLRGGRLALGPREGAFADMGLEDGQIASISSTSNRFPAEKSESHIVDLRGFLVLPGLINAHDHLEFALFPRLGQGGYQNWIEWAKDIYRPDESPVREHRAIPKCTRLWWGAIRNLLCGVTTVCHHNPYVAEVFDDGFPVRVVRDFGWSHSLAIEADIGRKHADTPRQQPFIIHLGEGVDGSSAEELFELDRIGALTERTVVVHGLAVNEQGLSLLSRRGAALVWCPSSNVFLFGRTHDRESLRRLAAVALGSDSSLTANGDLLDELRFARGSIGLSAEELYAQATLGAADALRLHSGEGSLRIGAVADLIAIRDLNLTPAETLARSTYRDIELVVVGGRIQLASLEIKDRLDSEVAEGLEPLEIDGELRWIRAPLARLFADARSAVGHDLTMNGRPLNYGAA